jgi:hypothetical protein
MSEIVQFKNGKFGVRAQGGGMLKSPYLFMRNDTYGWCDPSVALPREYEFDSRGAAESSALILANVQIPDFGVPA